MFCEFACCLVQHPNHATKVANLNCTTNVDHHPSQYKVCLLVLDFVLFFCLCLYFFYAFVFCLSKVGVGFCSFC